MGSMVVLNFVFFKSLKLYSYIKIDFQFLFTGEHWMLPRIWIWSQQDEVYEEQQTGVEGNADQLRHPHRWIPVIFGQYVFFCIIIHLPLPRLAVHLLSRMKLAMCTFFPTFVFIRWQIGFLRGGRWRQWRKRRWNVTWKGKGIRKQIVQEWNAVVRKGKVGTVLLNYIEGQALREASLRPMLLFHPNVVCVH